MRVESIQVSDVRFPTSHSKLGSDAINTDGDHSATYVEIHTDVPGLSGFGITFTIGRGNDICVEAARQRALPLVGRDISNLEKILGDLYREIQQDSQLRWLGPDKGVVHLATAAVMNALWDLAAKKLGKPLWRLLADMSPEEIVDAADLTYLSDALSREDALEILRHGSQGKQARLQMLRRNGYPAYDSSPGWLLLSDSQLRDGVQRSLGFGFNHIKLKIGRSIDDDQRRCAIAREEMGWKNTLLLDANQAWEVSQAIEWIQSLSAFAPGWIEEPTSPDDVLGHLHIKEAVRPIRIATGEHGMNRILFKQYFQMRALDVCQLDMARLAGVNEVLSVYLLAAHFDIPVCPHAGGVGLCEMVQHMAIFDFISVSCSLEGRIAEYVDHLHEHFVDPVQVSQGAYTVPDAPGYSTQLHSSTLAQFTYPKGSYWESHRS